MSSDEMREAAMMYADRIPPGATVTMAEWADLIGDGNPRNKWYADRIKAVDGTAERTYRGTLKVSRQ